jgi:hypothetical protein
MQGPIENALMMVCAGNAFLRGADIEGFWPDALTFKFMKTCEFRVPPQVDGDDYPLVAGDPMAWFDSLKPWARGLRLHYGERPLEPGQMPGIAQRMMVGFVGGGPRWLVEVVGPENSEVWEGFDRLGDRNDPQKHIWEKTYIRVGTATPDQVSPVSLETGLAALRGVLPEIEAYARDEKLDGFADCFARALGALDGPAPESNDYFDSFRRYTGAGESQIRALSAVMDAWVFGGMGSWNDTGGGERYDSLSERLFESLCDTISGIGNSTFRA